MTDSDGPPQPETDGPAPSDAAQEGADRTVRQRIADRWNRPGFPGKPSVILAAAGTLAVVAAGIYAVIRSSADDEDADELVAGFVDLLSPSPAEQDTAEQVAVPDAAKPEAPGQGAGSPNYTMEEWDSAPYMRDTCLNPDLHPEECEHELRPVAGSTKQRRKDLLDPPD
ncbi:hypothetical protein [Kitasatospora aureofaciens]|uniref:hypothetical protein n=1 Tax=Kitasatospora aureofaciens TaxID=1894 RepID=UPI0033F66E82